MNYIKMVVTFIHPHEPYLFGHTMDGRRERIFVPFWTRREVLDAETDNPYFSDDGVNYPRYIVGVGSFIRAEICDGQPGKDRVAKAWAPDKLFRQQKPAKRTNAVIRAVTKVFSKTKPKPVADLTVSAEPKMIRLDLKKHGDTKVRIWSPGEKQVWNGPLTALVKKRKDLHMQYSAPGFTFEAQVNGTWIHCHNPIPPVAVEFAKKDGELVAA